MQPMNGEHHGESFGRYHVLARFPEQGHLSEWGYAITVDDAIAFIRAIEGTGAKAIVIDRKTRTVKYKTK